MSVFHIFRLSITLRFISPLIKWYMWDFELLTLRPRALFLPVYRLALSFLVNMKDFLRSVPRLPFGFVTFHSFIWALIIVNYFISCSLNIYMRVFLSSTCWMTFTIQFMFDFFYKAFYNLLNLNFHNNECVCSLFDLLYLCMCIVSRALKYIRTKSFVNYYISQDH